MKPKPFEEVEWTKLRQAVGLDSEEKVDRLTRVLVVHLIVDRLLTLSLASKLAACSQSIERRDVEKIIGDIAPLHIPTRVNLASDMGLIPPGIVEKILAINEARNRLVHFKPKQGKPAWDVDGVEEIASQDACDRCTQKGIGAVQALMAVLNSEAVSEKPGTDIMR